MKIFFKRLKKIISDIIQRLNFFDALVFLILLVISMILLINSFQKKEDWIDLRLSIENSDWWYDGEKPDFWYANSLTVGDVAYDSFGKEIAVVKQIENYDSGEEGRKIYVNLSVKAGYDKKKQQYFYEFKPLLVGTSVIFNFSENQLRGTVIGLGSDFNYYPTEYKNIRVRVNFVLPELASQVKIGLKNFDSQGNLVAEVLGFNQEITRYYEFSDIRGKKILIYDPEYRLLLIDLKVKTFETFGQYYYVNNIPLKIGQMIDLNFPNFVLKDLEIIGLE